MRRATHQPRVGVRPIYISIHALHEESDRGRGILERQRHISIHALHEESDCYRGHRDWSVDISIHALHEESDCCPWGCVVKRIVFQSTLSMRRATLTPPILPAVTIFQSTLSMRRATIAHVPRDVAQFISIHALHEESDHNHNPTITRQHISIHALHEESDSAAGHFCPLFETQASCLALSISNNTADTTNNMSKTSNWLSVSF